MTPVFCCGFECGRMGIHWENVSGTGEFSTGTVRSGARSMRLAATASICRIRNYALPSSNIWVARFAVYFAQLPSTNVKIFGGDTDGCGVGFYQADSTLRPLWNGAPWTFGSNGFVVTTGQWYYVDARWNTSADTFLIDARVNGTALNQLSVSAAAISDTRLSFILGSSPGTSTFDVYYDDIVLSNTSADYPIGNGYVNHFVPTSDGTHNVAGANDFERGTTGTDIVNATTDSYLLVDDVPMDDTTPDADDFINCVAPPNATDYTENVFGPAPGISTPTAGPRAVEVAYAHHEAGTGNGVSASKLNDNGTVADIYNPGSVAGVTTIRYATKQFATMPADAAAWTAARFNNLRIRFGYSSDANPDQGFDCTMIEAEFASIVKNPFSLGFINGA